MGTLHLVTGYQGTAHVTAKDQGLLNAGFVGTGEYVLNVGKRFEAQIVSNNAIRIYDGTLLMQGRQVNLESGAYIEAIISNGTQSQNRHDLIVMRYTKDQTTGVESVGIAVIQGTPSNETPNDPSYNNTSILNDAAIHDMPLYRVKLSGLSIESIEPMFNVLAPLGDFQHKQNLLINGDFQCNQRGNKTYDVGNTSAYTVDMWRAYQVKVDVFNDGVKLTGKSTTTQGYFTQFIQLGKLKTTDYTIVAMVDGEIYTFTLTPGATAKEQDFGKFKITALTTSVWDNDLPEYNYYSNKLKINICPIGTSTFKLSYVDVYEGSVAYPHTKEDYATALMRCEMYIRKKGYTAPIYSIYSPSSGSYAYEFVLCFDKMAKPFNAYLNPPMVESYSWNYVTTGGTVNSGENPDIAVYNITNGSGVHTLRTAIGTLNMHSNCSAVKGVYVVTCEPRDA